MAALVVTLLLFVIFLLCFFLVRFRKKMVQLQQQNQQMSLALDHVNACIYIKDTDSRYVYANKPCLELFGVNQQELRNSPDDRFFPPETVKQLRQIDLEVLEKQVTSLKEVEVTDQSGKTIIYLESKYPLPYTSEEGKTLVGISTDITELWTLRKKLEQQAWYDGLTGLYNRLRIDQIFLDQFSAAKTNNTPFSIVLLDLDLFKAINDEHGHQIGDQVLQQAAQIIEHMCQNGQVASRWGGEEFLVLCPDTDQQEAMIFAENMKQAIKTGHYPVTNTITASIGVATLNQDYSEDELLKRADDALYSAKNSGRNKIVCGELQQHIYS